MGEVAAWCKFGRCFIDGSRAQAERSMPMRMTLPVLAMLASAAGAQVTPKAPITVTGHAWAPFVSPMGEPFRARTRADNTLALWFYQADANRDGLLTADEMVADADRFFAKLDTDHDGEIGPEELIAYEWEVVPEIQLSSKRKRLPSDPPEQTKAGDADDDLPQTARQLEKERRRDFALDGGLQGGARYSLLNMPEPVASADADFNRSITLAEFRQAALSRFQLLDRAHQGRLSFEQLQAMVPVQAKRGRRAPSDDVADQRIGTPLPPGN
jgi:hypothetical protein